MCLALNGLLHWSHCGRPLSAVSGALVGDVAYVVGIETLRSTPFIVDRSTRAKLASDRTFTPRPRLIESSPARLLPGTAHLCRLFVGCHQSLGLRVQLRRFEILGARTRAALHRLLSLILLPRKIDCKEAVDLGARHQASPVRLGLALVVSCRVSRITV